MSPNRRIRLSALAALLPFAACAGEERSVDDDTAVVPERTAAVTILEPTEDAELDGSSVTVRLSATGVEIAPAGELIPGTGHHHLYLDEDLGAAGQIVPTVPGSVIHLGTGAAEYVVEHVAPGTHRLIAVVADGLHVPLQPWVTDTVTFTVR